MTDVGEQDNWDVAAIREKTITGVGWSMVAQIWNQGSQFVISVILARLLTPSDFGLVGMVIVFTGFAAIFRDMGFSSALIQRREVEDRHYSSVFWFNVMIGLFLTLTFVVAAPLISKFYDEPRLTSLTRLVAASFFIGSLGMVHGAMLSRAMDFRTIARLQIAIVTLSGAVGIVMALVGFGVWSLVLPGLLTAPINLFFLWWVTHWRPRIVFDRSAVKELFGYGANVTGVNVLNYWDRNADNLLVGKFFGTAALGIYSRAYNTMLLPVSQVWSVLNRVMFPALSKLQNDKTRVKGAYLRCLAMIALITFPMMMGLFCVADHFVVAVYGAKWVGVVRVLQILSLVGMMQSLITTTGWIFQSQGRVDWMLKWEIAGGSVVIIGFLIGVYIGTIEAVATCYGVAEMVLLYWSFTLPGRLIDLTFGEVIQSVIGIFGCSVFMAAAVYTLGLLLPLSWPHWAFLAVQVPFGAILYVSIVHTLKLKAYLELRALLSERVTSQFRTGGGVRADKD